MKLVLTWNVRLFKYLTSIWTFTDGSLWDGQVMAAKTQNRLMISIFYSGLQSKFMTVQTLAFLHIFDWSCNNCQNIQDVTSDALNFVVLLCLLRNLMHQTLLCLESGLSKRTLLGRRVTLLGQVQYFKVAPSIHETSLNLGFNFSPNFMWAHGFQSNWSK